MKKAITIQDYVEEGRMLNFSSITNFEKAIPQDTFVQNYPKDKFIILGEAEVNKFISDINSKATEVLKGGDIPGTTEIFNDAKKVLSSMKRHAVILKAGDTVDFYTVEKPEEAKDDNIEKALDSFSYGENKMMFTKTGKEIKEKVSEIRKSVEDHLTTYKKENLDLLDEIPHVPTESLDSWDINGIEDEPEAKLMKRFSWNKTYFETDNGKLEMEPTEGSVTGASSKDEATNCRKFNDNVSRIISCLRDLKKIGVFERNVEDNKKYELTVAQASELGF